MSMKKIFIYARFERFWHWAQAALIILLGITGFEIHGTYRLIGFGPATVVHNVAALLLIVLAVFAIFWHFTTGEWRQYIPTTENLRTMVRFYTSGIFHNEPHPQQKTRVSKLNPLQRLTYLGFKLLIFPVLATTGILYLRYENFAEMGLPLSLETIALVHTAAAFLITVFLIVHVYMTTTGRTVFSNIKAMITGYEKIEEAGETPSSKETVTAT
jgi:thiosulfate reductase cytochrome b subunit